MYIASFNLKYWFALVLVLALSACASLEPQSTAVIKPDNDQREYEYLRLPNGMRVLLVSDIDADMAAASLTVAAGSADNPPGRDGLAHFLEHMLFMGTQKYPGVEDYAAFIRQHGGSQNAFTAETKTTYYFDIKQDKLEPALDRFAQFFIAPLMSEKYVAHEVNAVQSEYQLNLKEDMRRINAAQLQAMNPQSPYARFKVGSLETLADRPGDLVRDDLLEFFQTYYSASNMTLAVLGKEPLAQLKHMVEEKFGAVPERGKAPSEDNQPLYAVGSLPLLTKVVPLKDMRKLEFEFPIPSQIARYKTHPGVYLAHLIGHEGEGSLLSLLKSKGWVTSLSAGSDSMDERLGLFSVSMELTPEGYENWQAIGGYLFQAIRLLRERGIEDWRYIEQQRMARLNFRFGEKKSPSYTVVGLSSDLNDYPPQDVLRADTEMEVYDQRMIRELCDLLVPENLSLTLVAPGIKTSNVESFYQTAYSVEPLDRNLSALWSGAEPDKALVLPAANPFIPDQVEMKVVARQQTEPQRLDAGISFPLWVMQDDSFGVPKSVISFILKSPVARDSIQHDLLKTLYKQMIDDQLNEYAYQAQVAGLNYSLKDIPEGLRLTLYGYDQRLPLLLERIIQVLRKPELQQDRFDLYKARLARALRNQKLEQPYLQVIAEFKHYLLFPSYTPEQKLAVLPSLELEDVRAYADAYFNQLEVKALGYGNLTEADASAMAKQVQEGLLGNTRLVSVPAPKVEDLRAKKPVREAYQVDHPDSVVLRYFQGTEESLKEQAEWRLLGQMMSSPIFAELRSEQQLGYVVGAAYKPVEEMPGLVQIVQSSSAPAAKVEKSLVAFSKDFGAQLDAMPADEFAANQQGLIAELTKKDETYLEAALRHLDALMRKKLDFHYEKHLAEIIAGVGQAELRDFYRNIVLEKPKQLTVFSNGSR